MKKFLTTLSCFCLLVFVGIGLVGCNDPELNNYGFDASISPYNAKVLVTEAGVIMNRQDDTEITSSGTTYFGQEDKNLEWNGKNATFNFVLDVSSMEENDFTMWVLGFSKHNGDGTYSHGGEEIRFGIAKTSGGFVANSLVGIDHNDTTGEENLASITTGGINVNVGSDNKVNVTIKVSFYENNEQQLTTNYTFLLNETTISPAEKPLPNPVVGFRYLWNARTNCDGVVFSNLTYDVPTTSAE